MANGVFIVIRRKVAEEYEYLCLHRKDPISKRYPAGVCELPGGGIDEYESVNKAALREAWEELGWSQEILSNADIKHLAMFEKDRIGNSYYFIYDLPVGDFGPEVRITEAEHIGHGWYTIKQIEELGKNGVLARTTDVIHLADGKDWQGIDSDLYYTQDRYGIFHCEYGVERENLLIK